MQTLKVGDQLIGNHTRAKVVKNKVAPPFREAEFDIMYGQGISKEGELVDLGVQLGLVEKSGSWFSMGETRLGQGRDNAKNYFKEHPEEAKTLDAAIRENAYKLMGKPSKTAAKAAEEMEEVAPADSIDVSAEDFDG